jgi:acyl-CoA reductase-like NAD-dependent aldehyde dehydrogenase
VSATLDVTSAAAVDGAIAAAGDYARAPLSDIERCEALRHAGRLLREQADELAELLVADVRKPRTLARLEVSRSAEVAEASAAEWETIRGEVVPAHAVANSAGRLVLARRHPLGIVCAITPFNFPIALTIHKLAPALVAGNACIVKPSEHATRTVEALARLFVAAGFPESALPVVPGGPEAVDALLGRREIGLYSFTGSVPVGEKIKRGSGVRPVILELGSNAATIVHGDADLERAAKAIAIGAYAFGGQACFSPQRILVHEEVKAAFTDALLEQIDGLRVGEPTSDDVLVGPLITEAAAARVEALIDDAVMHGATLLAGGKRDGPFVAPTLLTDVPREARLWEEEAFGPVALLAGYTTVDEAFEQVNDTRFGLQTGVFTRDVGFALEAAERIVSGAVIVNEPSSWRCTPMPFGGVRDSGFGREGPRYAIEAMTYVKTVAIAG